MRAALMAVVTASALAGLAVLCAPDAVSQVVPGTMPAGMRPAAPAPVAAASPAPRQAEGNLSDWPQWRGPNRDGKSPDKGLLKEWPREGPKLLWKVDDIGAGFSGPSISGGMVYITGDVGNRLVLFAFDSNGLPKWKVDHAPAWTGREHAGARSSPTVEGGKVYIVSGGGVIGCYDAKTGGRPVWTKEMREFGGRTPSWGYSESVLIHEGLAIVTPGGQNCIVALDKNTGQHRWSSQGFNARAHYGSCIAFTFQNVPMVVAGTGDGIVGMDARSGAVLWSNPFSAGNTANCPTPAYADGHVFWANGYGKGGICLRLAVSGNRVTAQEAWTTRDMVCHHGGYVIHEGHVYGNHGGGWACLDLKTGQRKWSDSRAMGKGSLCWADGMLYLYGERDGKVALATCSPDRLEVKGRFSVQGSGSSWAHPVVAGGRLYIRYDTNLYCYDVKAR